MHDSTTRPAAILLFPIQKKSIPECATDAEIILQSRLTAIRLINRTILGAHRPTESNREYIRELNELFAKHGQPPLEFNF